MDREPNTGAMSIPEGGPKIAIRAPDDAFNPQLTGPANLPRCTASACRDCSGSASGTVVTSANAEWLRLPGAGMINTFAALSKRLLKFLA